jgi:carbonic anhydrase
MHKLSLLLLVTGSLVAQVQDPQGDVSCANPNACWEVLERGNQHWADDPIRLTHPNQDAQRRSEVANPNKEQRPFAVILTCSDSRVPPELIFDRGLGDLFVVRLAGNVVGKDVNRDFALGSIQYAVSKLKAKLVVVLGHQQCGAAQAAFTYDPRDPGPLPLRSLVQALLPAVRSAKRYWGNSINADDVSDANVYDTIPKIQAIAGRDAVKGMRYNLNGKVVELRAVPAK